MDSQCRGRFIELTGKKRSPVALQNQNTRFTASFWKFCPQVVVRIITYISLQILCYS